MSEGLAGVFARIAVKRLSAVEALPSRSHQHEFNGVTALKELFGAERSRRPARFLYLGDTDEDAVAAEGFLTWYDARQDHPTRSEYRLYFQPTAASEQMRPGDTAFFLMRPDGAVLAVFARAGSTAEDQLSWLFSVAIPNAEFRVASVAAAGTSLGFAARRVLETLGIDVEPPPIAEESAYELLLERYGEGFPSTAEFSEFARTLTEGVAPVEDPDSALMAWLEREEALFRHLERHLLAARLETGFGGDVDAFLKFSLSVQNRRKARAGRALENHVEALLAASGVKYARGSTTEGSSKPDFLFPSAEFYRDPSFDAGRLRMLAVKSTCKDRWRQILAEADRIPVKHLLTIETSISVPQTKEMKTRDVRLVLPRELHDTFTESQRRDLLTVKAFLSQLSI